MQMGCAFSRSGLKSLHKLYYIIQRLFSILLIHLTNCKSQSFNLRCYYYLCQSNATIDVIFAL